MCWAWRRLSCSSLWTKEEHIQWLLSCNGNLKLCLNVAAPLLTPSCGDLSRSRHPGSSSILDRWMFHLFQLTSSTLKQQEDTCFNYCSRCDTSISHHKGQISEEHGVLVDIDRWCSRNCIFRPKTVLLDCYHNLVDMVGFAVQWTNVWESFHVFHKYIYFWSVLTTV